MDMAHDIFNHNNSKASQLVQLVNLHHPDFYDSNSAKNRDIGTLNIFLYYMIFANGLT